MEDVKKLKAYSGDLSVLIVEDDDNLRTELQELLKVLFKTVDAAGDGQEGLGMYNVTSYDIIITDIEMPKLNGVDLTKKIKENNKEQIIIVISAYDDWQYLVPLINLHVDAFLQKPINHQVMLNTLYKYSKAVVDRKALTKYRHKLEEDTVKLSKKIKKLESILDSKEELPKRSERTFDSVKEIVSEIDKDRELILDRWVNQKNVTERLSKYNISTEFFKNHFGARVLDYFIGVINETNELGNCPVIVIMIDFFKNKNLLLEDIYTICIALKSTMIKYILEKNFYNEKLFDELVFILDKNFEGVISNYMKSLFFAKQPAVKGKIDKESCKLEDSPAVKKQVSNYIEYVMDHDIHELQELEVEIDNLVISITMTRDPKADQFVILGNKLSRYGSVLITYPIFTSLGNYIIKLSEHFLKDAEILQKDQVKFSNIALFIESFVNDLIVWRKEVFEIVTDDPDFLNKSFFSNIDTIIHFMEDDGEGGEDQIEFF